MKASLILSLPALLINKKKLCIGKFYFGENLDMLKYDMRTIKLNFYSNLLKTVEVIKENFILDFFSTNYSRHWY